MANTPPGYTLISEHFDRRSEREFRERAYNNEFKDRLCFWEPRTGKIEPATERERDCWIADQTHINWRKSTVMYRPPSYLDNSNFVTRKLLLKEKTVAGHQGQSKRGPKPDQDARAVKKAYVAMVGDDLVLFEHGGMRTAARQLLVDFSAYRLNSIEKIIRPEHEAAAAKARKNK